MSKLDSLADRLDDMATNGYVDRATVREVAAILRAMEHGLITWLHAHADYSGEDCLIWPFRSRNPQGYAYVGVGRKPVGVHRMMCEIAHGPPPTKRMQAAHSCGTRDCVNPAHLRWATPKSNHADKVMHGTQPRGEARVNSKLTNAAVVAIRQGAACGLLHRDLAGAFGVSRETIGNVVRRKTWKHVEETFNG